MTLRGLHMRATPEITAAEISMLEQDKALRRSILTMPHEDLLDACWDVHQEGKNLAQTIVVREAARDALRDMGTET
jgi:hypothetical protein